MKLVSFKIEHLRQINIRPHFHGDLAFVLGVEHVLQAAENKYSWTMLGHDDRVVTCGGIARTGQAWAFVAAHMTPAEALYMTRNVRRLLAQFAAEVGPITCEFEQDDPIAMRWARAVGFQPAAMNGHTLLSFG